MHGPHAMPPAPHMRPPMQASVPKPDGVLQPNQQKSSVHLEDSFLNQHENGDHNSAIPKSQVPSAVGQKALPLSFGSLVLLEFYNLLLLFSAIHALAKYCLRPMLDELNQICQ